MRASLDRRFILLAIVAGLPAVVVAHHITYDGDPDSYPLHMASKILSDGNSSRIYRKLVYESDRSLTIYPCPRDRASRYA